MLIGRESHGGAANAGVKAWVMLQGLANAQREGVWVDELQNEGRLWHALC